ncbi:MAG: FAD-dependent oxidoreductase [Methanosarcinales archaeon]|nr:FAD-dependent oxidoreductase [Methanosarcinales archaeon]
MQVAVIGGGMAGAELVRLASSRRLDITLIEPKHQVECQALYPDYMGGLVRVEDMTAPLRPFCEKVGAKLVNEKALAIEDHEVVCERTRVPFDVAVVATGAVQNYFGIRGVEHTFSLNTLEETMRAREYAESTYPDRIMVIGSGLTGIETACVLADSMETSIYVIEAMDRLLPVFPAGVSCRVEKALGRKGINVITNARVAEVTRDSIIFHDGSSLDCDMAIWTAGIKRCALSQDLDLPMNRGWIQTDQYLRAAENIFVLGDCAWVEIGGRIATKTGIEAERQASHTARNLHHLARGKPLKPYSILAGADHPLALISTGNGCALGVYGDSCLPVPSRLLHVVKRWIDKSITKRYL